VEISLTFGEERDEGEEEMHYIKLLASHLARVSCLDYGHFGQIMSALAFGGARRSTLRGERSVGDCGVGSSRGWRTAARATARARDTRDRPTPRGSPFERIQRTSKRDSARDSAGVGGGNRGIVADSFNYAT
jgi:hypothetical protein